MKLSLAMNSSLLASQIALFYYSADAAALVQNHVLASPRKPCRDLRRWRNEVSSSLLAESFAASSSSSSSSADLIEMLPVVPQRRRLRHPLFRDTNVVSRSMPVPHPDLWRRVLPIPHPDIWRRSLPPSPRAIDPCSGGGSDDSFWDAARNLLLPQNKPMAQQHHRQVSRNEVHVQFTNPATGARQLLQQCGVVSTSQNNESTSPPSLPLPETITAETETLNHITSVLSYFQTVAAPPNGPANVECTARIVSTIGSAGIKCPRWHADHVPVRLVMSLLGPGCDYIPEKIAGDDDRPWIVNRLALNNLEENDTVKANDIIVPPELLSSAENDKDGGATIKHAQEGEVVLLMGRGWEDDAADRSLEASETTGRRVLAAVHRSPSLLRGQERILLTVDLADWI